MPAVLHKLAVRLYVDCLDLVVYSQSFRMWRCANIQRENGRYKAPITHDELIGMTPKSYLEMTAAPRPMPSLDVPTLAPDFGELFCQAEDRVAKITASTPRAKTVTSDEVLSMSPTHLCYEIVKRSLKVEQFASDYLEGFWSGNVFKAKNPRRKNRNPENLVV